MVIARRSLLASGGAALLGFGAPVFAAAPLSADVFSDRLPQGSDRGFTTAADGQRIAWEMLGRGKIDLIFVHGWMCDRSYWFRQAAGLQDRYRLILIDLPGHGDSLPTRRQWSIRSYADDVTRVASQLAKGRPVYLVGHSMGGSVVALAAASTGAVIGVCAADSFVAAKPPAVPAPSAATGATYVLETRVAIRRGMFVASSDPVIADRIANAMATGPEDIAKALLPELSKVVGAPALMAMPPAVPLVLINSERHVPDLDSIRSAHVLTEATVLKNTGHFVMIDAAEAFNAALDKAVSAGLARSR